VNLPHVIFYASGGDFVGVDGEGCESQENETLWPGHVAVTGGIIGMGYPTKAFLVIGNLPTFTVSPIRYSSSQLLHHKQSVLPSTPGFFSSKAFPFIFERCLGPASCSGPLSGQTVTLMPVEAAIPRLAFSGFLLQGRCTILPAKIQTAVQLYIDLWCFMTCRTIFHVMQEQIKKLICN
jgi:hypothetical protein